MKPEKTVIIRPRMMIATLLLLHSVIPLFIATNWGYFSSPSNSTASADGQGAAIGMLFFVLLLILAALGLLVFLWYSLKLFDMRRPQNRPANYGLAWVAWTLAALLVALPLIVPIIGSLLTA